MAQSPAIQAIVEGLRESAARMEEFAARSRELAQQLEGGRGVHGVQAIEALAPMERRGPGGEGCAPRRRERAQKPGGVRPVHGVQAIEALALMKRITPGWDDAMGQFETMKVAIESLVEPLRR